ncbi:MAG: hypothetical protein H9W81_07680 [Enterococcus sp.]|nr:hypothetical protein [Enterococcus sp.]
MTSVNNARGMVVSVSDAMDGAGKIIVASTLAALLARGGRENDVPRRSVCYVEINVHNANFGAIAGKHIPNASDLVMSIQEDWNDEAVRQCLVSNDRLGFHTLLGPGSNWEAEQTTPALYAKALEYLRRMFDYVVAVSSTGPGEVPYRDVAVRAADVSLLVTSGGDAHANRAGEWLSEMLSPVSDGGRGFDREKFGVIATNSAGDEVSMLENFAPLLASLPVGAFDEVISSDMLGDYSIHPEKLDTPGLDSVLQFIPAPKVAG